MKDVPYSFLRTGVEKIKKLLHEEGVLVLTSRGTPFAIMIDIGEDALEDAMSLASQVRAKKAVASLREQAKERGLDGLSMEEVNEEILKARTDRSEGSSNPHS